MKTNETETAKLKTELENAYVELREAIRYGDGVTIQNEIEARIKMIKAKLSR